MMRYENIQQQNGVAKTNPVTISVHVCGKKVLRRSPTSSGIHLVVLLRVSRGTAPRFHALKLFFFRFEK